MMTRQLLAALLLLSTTACTREIVKQNFAEECPYSFEEMREHELALERMMYREYGLDARGWTRKIVVECRGAPEQRGDQLIDGEALGPRNVWIATTHPDGVTRPLCATSHLHEVTHALFMGLLRDDLRYKVADYEHAHPVWRLITPYAICERVWW